MATLAETMGASNPSGWSGVIKRDPGRSNFGLHPVIFQSVIPEGQTDEVGAGGVSPHLGTGSRPPSGPARADGSAAGNPRVYPVESGPCRTSYDADEERAVELKREMVARGERVVWNPALSLPMEESEFSDQEIARLKADRWHVGFGWRCADRLWLQPLVDAG